MILNKKMVVAAVGFGVVLGATLAVVRVCGGRSADQSVQAEVSSVEQPVVCPAPVVETQVVTNFVEVVVTNVVTVTNVVELKPPERVLSLRKTAPYLVTSDVLPAAKLVEHLSKAGARVLRAYPASRALVEANDTMVAAMGEESGLYRVEPLAAEDKIGAGVLPLTEAGENAEPVTVVLVVHPVSSIDVGQIVTAINRLGGEAKAEIVEGRPLVRAKLSEDKVVELARRGDVRRIERDK